MTTSRRVLVVNGPNLNLLGEREPGLYGRATLLDVEESVTSLARELGWEATFVQSNHEGVLIDHIHEVRRSVTGIIINAGGLTHTSVSLRDALSAARAPFIEVHVTNVHAREEFRHHSFLSPVAAAVIVGAGIHGYGLAMRHLDHLERANRE
jgi:3-dehydroquinate dehydratase-2